MNKVILTGRLTADPVLRQTQSGISSCRFTVAVNRRFADKSTGERGADFITCTAWRQTAEFVSRHFNKGKPIAVEGTLRTGSYQDKNHPDVTHYTAEVYADNIEFVGSKNDSQTAAPDAADTADETRETGAEQTFDLSQFEEIISDGVVPF